MDIIKDKLQFIKENPQDFVSWPDAEGQNSKCFSMRNAHCIVVIKNEKEKSKTEQQILKNEKHIKNLEAMKPALEKLRKQGTHVPRYFGCFIDKEDHLYSVQLKMPGEGILPTPFGYERFASPTEVKLDRLLNAPEKHFNQFAQDVAAIIDEGIYIDFMNPTNFLYDPHYGFSFIDFEPIDQELTSSGYCKDRAADYLVNSFTTAFFCEDNHDKDIMKEKYAKTFLRFIKAFDQNGFEAARRVGRFVINPNQIMFFLMTDMRNRLRHMFGQNIGPR